MYILLVVLIALIIFICYFLINDAKLQKEQEKRFIDNHRRIKIGMDKKQVVWILGANYTQSLLKNGIEKYEWAYRKQGYYGRITKGVYAHSGSLTRKICVKFKDDCVVEVHSLNMDT